MPARLGPRLNPRLGILTHLRRCGYRDVNGRILAETL
jgi:hypothetical protein